MQGKQKLQAEGVPAEQIFAGDIVESREVLERSLQGADALVIATSGVPQIKPLSLIGVRQRSRPPSQEWLAPASLLSQHGHDCRTVTDAAAPHTGVLEEVAEAGRCASRVHVQEGPVP